MEVVNLTFSLRRFINIRLLSLLPHEVPLEKFIALDSGHHRGSRVVSTQISGARITLMIEVSSFTMARRHTELIAWDLLRRRLRYQLRDLQHHCYALLGWTLAALFMPRKSRSPVSRPRRTAATERSE